MIQEFLKAFMLIFIAEMGDKTQILAMAFATKFPVKKVLIGIFIGSVLNHGLAVLLGSYMSKFIPISTVQIIAGFVFIVFAIWTLKPESDSEEGEKESKFKINPILTVALAFFIGELGDKTQLTAITLAVDSKNILLTLLGTVSGMLATGGLGIIIGKTIGGKVPEIGIKFASSAVFLFFGITKLYSSIPSKYLTIENIATFLIPLIIIIFILLRKNLVIKSKGIETDYKKQSKELYDYYERIAENLESLCERDKCLECRGNDCPIKNTQTLILDKYDRHINKLEFPKKIPKEINRQKAAEGLDLTMKIIKESKDLDKLDRIKRNFEILLNE